jgi:hypothetical protein
MRPHARLVTAAFAALLAQHPRAQVPGEVPMPMADYLGLLEQIAPAARRGAEAYVNAHQQRCGRAVTTAELRLAMSRDAGDPVLMGMIRASHLQDAKALAALTQGLSCRGGK